MHYQNRTEVYVEVAWKNKFAEFSCTYLRIKHNFLYWVSPCLVTYHYDVNMFSQLFRFDELNVLCGTSNPQDFLDVFWTSMYVQFISCGQGGKTKFILFEKLVFNFFGINILALKSCVTSTSVCIRTCNLSYVVCCAI